MAHENWSQLGVPLPGLCTKVMGQRFWAIIGGGTTSKFKCSNAEGYRCSADKSVITLLLMPYWEINV